MEKQVATMARENSGTAPVLRTYCGIRGVTLVLETLKGGCTLDFESPTLAPAQFTTGYYVVTGDDGTTMFPLKGSDTRHYQAAIKAAWRASNGSGLMGTWLHKGMVHTGPTKWFYSLSAATKAARAAGQLSIWDIAANQEIFL